MLAVISKEAGAFGSVFLHELMLCLALSNLLVKIRTREIACGQKYKGLLYRFQVNTREVWQATSDPSRESETRHWSILSWIERPCLIEFRGKSDPE